MNVHLEKEIKLLEVKLEALLQSWQPAQLKSVSSIKGIGKRATAMLIVFTQGFKYTQNHRQLISFAGLSPCEYSSGSSIQGKPRINKRGGKNLRDVLYMCALQMCLTWCVGSLKYATFMVYSKLFMVYIICKICRVLQNKFVL